MDGNKILPQSPEKTITFLSVVGEDIKVNPRRNVHAGE